MSKVRVSSFAVSLDGYGAGPNQSLGAPLGVRGEDLHRWVYPTQTFKDLFGGGKGTQGVDNDFTSRGMANVGAWILGRNMFSPMRGAWSDETWKGWWGENPPYHVPTFVLTHHARPSIEMAGGTTFHFVTGGHLEALRLAKVAAGDRDVRVGGGAATVRQYLQDRLLDELHLAISPVVLGAGEPLFHGLNWSELGYRVVEHRAGEGAMHVVVKRV
jgi:dihydrofolate reductase